MFTALAFTCNHFFTRQISFKRSPIPRPPSCLSACYSSYSYSLYIEGLVFYLFSLPTFLPLPSFPSFLFLSFPLSLLDCPVFFSSLRCLFPSFWLFRINFCQTIPQSACASFGFFTKALKSYFAPRLSAFVFVWEFQLYNWISPSLL